MMQRELWMAAVLPFGAGLAGLGRVIVDDPAATRTTSELEAQGSAAVRAIPSRVGAERNANRLLALRTQRCRRHDREPIPNGHLR